MYRVTASSLQSRINENAAAVLSQYASTNFQVPQVPHAQSHTQVLGVMSTLYARARDLIVGFTLLRGTNKIAKSSASDEKENTPLQQQHSSAW